jgi:hypothetical protein
MIHMTPITVHKDGEDAVITDAHGNGVRIHHHDIHSVIEQLHEIKKLINEAPPPGGDPPGSKGDP